MGEGKLIAYFQSMDEHVNTIESGGHVQIVFTDPPDNASGVELAIIEATEVGKHLEHQAERKLLTFKGHITNKEFIIDTILYHYQPPKDNKRSPTVWIEAGQHPSYDLQITLPDDREENDRFDLRLDIKGNINGKNKNRKGLALLHVYYPMDVMIIPASDGTNDNALGFLRTWAKQWKQHATATRAIVEMPLDTAPINQAIQPYDYDNFRHAFHDAIHIAHGGIIALAVGHGWGGNNDLAWTHLVPEDRKITVHENEDEDVPTRLSVDQNDLTEGLESAPGSPAAIPAKPATLNALSDLGDIASSSPRLPEELRLQSCNVGGSLDFLAMMADRVGIPVRGHVDSVAYHIYNQKVYCHYYIEKGDDLEKYYKEVEKTQTEHNLHEWPEDKLSSAVLPYTPPPQRRQPKRF